MKHTINNTVQKYIYCMVVAFSLTIQNAVAADFNIRVLQKGSGIPVEGATVVIDDGTAYQDTPPNGRITFSDIHSAKQLKVLAAGYETLIKSIQQNENKLTVYLVPLLFQNEGLEVIADRVIEKTSKLTLGANELLKSAGSGGDPLKAMTALPGVIEAGEGSALVYMRGSNGNDNIAWINNAPVNYLYHFGGFQSTINPGLIEDINIFLGGFPVEYGDALGGVIDARLRAPKNDRLHYNVDISTITSSFLVEGPAGKDNRDSFFVAGRRSYLDLIFSPADANKTFADEDQEDPDQIILVPRFYDFQSLYRHQLQAGYIDTYVFTAGDELAFEVRDSAKSDPQFAGKFNSKISYQTIGTTWQQRLNNRWDTTATLAYIHSKEAIRLGRDESGESFFLRSEDKSVHFQPEFHFRATDRTRLSFGLNSGYSKIPIDAYIFRFPDENDPNFDVTDQNKFRVKTEVTASVISPYLKYRYRWTDRLTTQLGLRHTNIEVKGGFHAHKFSPRASLEYKFTQDTLFTSTWGQYIQTPRGSQIIENLGNPALLMREAEHRILGLEHKINALFSVKAEIYHKPMKNLVVSIDENQPPDNFANKGRGEAYGFDLFIKRKPSQGIIGWLSLSAAKSKRTNQITGITRNFSGDQPLTLVVVWGQPFTKNWKRWDWSVKGQIHSGKPYTAVTGRHREIAGDNTSRWIPEYGKFNAERYPTYYKVDLRIARDILHNQYKFKFYIDLQNVTFAKNIVEYDYGSEYEKIDQPTEISGIQFFPFFGVEWEF